MKKDLLVIAFIVLLLTILFKGTSIQSVEDYYTTHIDDITEESETVFISISAETLLESDNWDLLDENLQSEKYVPNDGMILEKTEYVLRDGDTVFDILKRTTRYNQIHMDYQDAAENIFNSVYVQGINQLYEFSAGPLSGWMYRVNREFPNYGVSRYELDNGDEIEFIYTVELGEDINFNKNSEGNNR